MFRAGLDKRVFECLCVIVSEFAVFVVIANLPVTWAIDETLLEACELLLLAEVHQELDDVCILLPI